MNQMQFTWLRTSYFAKANPLPLDYDHQPSGAHSKQVTVLAIGWFTAARCLAADTAISVDIQKDLQAAPHWPEHATTSVSITVAAH